MYLLKEHVAVYNMVFYVDKDAVEGLKAYKYSGNDNSLLYKYFASPLAQYMVDKWTPLWVAYVLIPKYQLKLIIHLSTLKFCNISSLFL